MTNEEILRVARPQICDKLNIPEFAFLYCDKISIQGDDTNGYRIVGYIDFPNNHGSIDKKNFDAFVSTAGGVPRVTYLSTGEGKSDFVTSEAPAMNYEPKIENENNNYEPIVKFKRDSHITNFRHCFVICVILACLGGFFMMGYSTFEFGVFLTGLAGTILSIAVDYLLAGEFAVIAREKGYEYRRYFWYSFIFTVIGYLMVIALPKKND